VRIFFLRVAQQTGVLLALLALLLGGDWLCYQYSLPVSIVVHQQNITLHVGSQVLSLNTNGVPLQVQFAPHAQVVHEYQLDGSDSTNNFTLDISYLHSISSTWYYRLQAWMRNLNGLSRWRNAQVWNGSHRLTTIAWPVNGSSIILPDSENERFTVELQQPETPMTLNLLLSNGTALAITLDRNDRFIAVTRTSDQVTLASTFFPTDPLPFAAMVIDFLLKNFIWAIVLLLVITLGESTIALLIGIRTLTVAADSLANSLRNTAQRFLHTINAARAKMIQCKRFKNIFYLHPFAFVALIVSFIYTCWIALYEYRAEPHIFDATAYFFTAKMYAQGRLWLSPPPASNLFPGPFMVVHDGRWFAQYGPGTSLTLVPGIWLGVPWLTEPLLGTFALLGIGLIAARLYDRKIASLTVVLGTLSPFYSYLAASYMSHTIALFYLVWGTWALLCLLQGAPGWNLPLVTLLFGMAILTRDEVALMIVTLIVLGLFVLHWRVFKKLKTGWRKQWWRWLIFGLATLSIILFFVVVRLGYNQMLTGNALTTPRSLFFPGDHWGFGKGVGFYGQHTLAAGFVNLDELLTSLAIDLFGWPFYLTLAFIAVLFLTRRTRATDWILLIITTLVAGAFIGYFYHGIYLGPRYLYETLPFLLILTARGIYALMATGQSIVSTYKTSYNGQLLSIALVLALFGCNLFYYQPRQLQIYHNYAALPAGSLINTQELYHPPMHHAIIVTDNFYLYEVDLFALNDPQFHGDVLYAFASNSADYQELQQAFPTRTIYSLIIAKDGNVSYKVIS